MCIHVAELEHLSTSEQKLLLKSCKKHDTLFGGGLGELKKKPIHLEVDPNATIPCTCFPAHAYEANTHKEIDRFTTLV
jgi:hypothetical protein